MQVEHRESDNLDERALTPFTARWPVQKLQRMVKEMFLCIYTCLKSFELYFNIVSKYQPRIVLTSNNLNQPTL